MRILPINIQSSNSKQATLNSACCGSSQGFKARLLVHDSARKVGIRKLDRLTWDKIITLFKDTLRNDPVKPNDLVQLRAFPSNKIPGTVYTGKSKLVEYMYSSYSTQRRESYQKAFREEPINGYEDLELSINKSSSGFMLNTDRTIYQIADDLYNTYKRVRYLEHFSK